MKLARAWIVSACLLVVGSSSTIVVVAFAPTTSIGRVTTVSTTRLCLEPLAKEGDWAAYLDQDNTGLVYYFNGKTGESKWEPPSDTFPSVYLTLQQREQARSKRSTYLKEKEAATPKKKLFSRLLDNNKKQEKKEKVKSVEANWFEGLFDLKQEELKAAATVAEAQILPVEVKNEEKVDSKKEEKSGFLSNMFGNQKKSGKSTTVAVETEVAAIVEETKVEKADFFSNVFGSTKKSVVVVVEKSVKETTVMDTASYVTETPATTKSSLAAPVTEEKIIAPVKEAGITIEMSSFVLPHPAKVSWGGEDAVFTKGRTFGVFDGVSGAEKLDGIPLYSTTLADEMKRMLGDNGLTLKEITTALTEAADFADRAATGASTAVVATIDNKNYLRVLNLGDSTCVVIRNNVVAAKTREIVHYFDCPYQLSEDSPDRPKDGTKLNVELLPGDVIVMGSDGIFDNLSDKVICEAVATSPEKAAAIAKRIVDLSRKVSLDSEAETPYAKMAKRNGFEDFESGRGGKLDDASCIVVRCT